MATMIAEVYEALIEAGASQEKAKKAAESIAAYENPYSSASTAYPSGFGSSPRLRGTYFSSCDTLSST